MFDLVSAGGGGGVMNQPMDMRFVGMVLRIIRLEDGSKVIDAEDLERFLVAIEEEDETCASSSPAHESSRTTKL